MRDRKPRFPKEGKYASLDGGMVKSNADIFQSRGDPWVSQREGMTQYGRNLDTEDVDYDRDHRARKPEERKPLRSEPTLVRGSDPAKRSAEIRHKLAVTLAKADTRMKRKDFKGQ